jgi:hypothetical protein
MASSASAARFLVAVSILARTMVSDGMEYLSLWFQCGYTVRELRAFDKQFPVLKFGPGT